MPRVLGLFAKSFAAISRAVAFMGLKLNGTSLTHRAKLVFSQPWLRAVSGAFRKHTYLLCAVSSSMCGKRSPTGVDKRSGLHLAACYNRKPEVVDETESMCLQVRGKWPRIAGWQPWNKPDITKDLGGLQSCT